MTERLFDVAVINEDTNGLFSAYELAKNNVSVVVFDNYKPSLDIDGYKFIYYPEHVFADYELPEIFEELHIPFETYTNPVYHLILPDRRVDICSGIQKMVPAINLRFGKEASKLVSYLQKESRISDILFKIRELEHDRHTTPLKKAFYATRLKRLLIREKRSIINSLKELAAENTTSVFIRAIAGYILPWVSEDQLLTDTDIAPLVLKKRFYPVGGKGSIKAAVMHELIKRKVNVIRDKELHLISRKKHFTITFDHGQTVQAKKIIVEPVYEKTLSLLPFGFYKKIKKKFYVDNIFVGLKRSCLPEVYNRTNNAVMAFNYHQPLFDDNLIFINTNPITDIKRAKNDMTALSITLLIKEANISRLSSIRAGALEHIKWFIPFFDDYAENIYFTKPRIIWDNRNVPVYKKGILMINDEFMNIYTFEEKYAYIKKQVQRLIKKL